MLTIQHYVKAKSLEEAYELNQKRSSRVMGGMMWLRLGNSSVQTIIDLSGLGLDQIEETPDTFRIGAMCTLRDLELHQGLRNAFGDAIAESVRHIVGVQFRNQATVGGSIFGRFGFSDILTCFLTLDTSVELYHGGIVPLSEFVHRDYDNDILISVILRKSPRKIHYSSVRRSETDFPVLACAVSNGTENGENTWYISVGARPMKASLLKISKDFSTAGSKEEVSSFSRDAAARFRYESNMRGSAEYRQHLAEVLIERAVRTLLHEKYSENGGQ